MEGKIKLIFGKLFTGAEHLGDVYFTEAENEILDLIDKEIIGEDEENEGKSNYTQRIRNKLRRKQRTKLRA